MTQTQVIEQMQPVFDMVFARRVPLQSSLTAHEVQDWDSLTHVSLILAVESAFNIRFRVGEVETTRNVGELADLVAKRVAKA